MGVSVFVSDGVDLVKVDVWSLIDEGVTIDTCGEILTQAPSKNKRKQTNR